MNDYLSNLAALALNQATVVRPRLAPLFGAPDLVLVPSAQDATSDNAPPPSTPQQVPVNAPLSPEAGVATVDLPASTERRQPADDAALLQAAFRIDQARMQMMPQVLAGAAFHDASAAGTMQSSSANSYLDAKTVVLPLRPSREQPRPSGSISPSTPVRPSGNNHTGSNRIADRLSTHEKSSDVDAARMTSEANGFFPETLNKQLKAPELVSIVAPPEHEPFASPVRRTYAIPVTTAGPPRRPTQLRGLSDTTPKVVPTIQVTIGRVEVRANPAANPVRAAAEVKRSSTTLEEYLKDRAKRGNS